MEAQIRGVVVAAPSLIAERGMPAKPSDLTGWPMISIHPFFDDTIPLRGIPLRGNAGRTAKTRGKPRFVTRNVVVARGAACYSPFEGGGASLAGPNCSVKSLCSSNTAMASSRIRIGPTISSRIRSNASSNTI